MPICIGKMVNDMSVSNMAISSIAEVSQVLDKEWTTRTATHKGATVHCRMLDFKVDINRESKKVKAIMMELKHINHTSINAFIGVTVRFQQTLRNIVLHVYCRRGGLDTLLDSNFLDWDLKFSLTKELIEAINYIRKTSFKFHGNITFKKCLVDEYFGLKLADLATEKLRLLGCEQNKTLLQLDPSDCMAPEVKRGMVPDSASDIFAFGVIARELLDLNVINNEHRYASQDEWEALVVKCVHYEPDERPLAKDLVHVFQNSSKTEGHTGSLFDIIMLRLERYSAKLEVLVEERTVDLIAERERCDSLLREILPAGIVRILRQGGQVDPEMFECASLMFNAISGFSNFVSRSTPFEVIRCLQELYSGFDMTLTKFRVYKVETIGEQYMVVSGLPERVADHADEICRLALAMFITFDGVPTDSVLGLQIGIHSGPIAAGVVGFRRPSYCLFGDTVNTSSRMYSSGEPNKIQLSYAVVPLLTDNALYAQERGEIAVKGKGMVKTYWLLPAEAA